MISRIKNLGLDQFELTMKCLQLRMRLLMSQCIRGGALAERIETLRVFTTNTMVGFNNRNR